MVLILAILALGFNSLMNMPSGEDPVVNFPRFFIVAVYPGASPIDLEDQVVDPLESRINELDEIKKVKSTIEDGLAIVDVEYEFEVDREEKYQEIIREVNIARAELPKDLYLLEVQEFNSSDVNIFQMALLSQKSSYADLEDMAEDLVDQLEKVKGIKKVESWGYPEQEVRVELNLEKIAQLGIPLDYIYGAIQSENLNIPGGAVQLNTRRFNVKTSGDFDALEDIENTVVFAAEGDITLLKDVAEVYLTYEEERHKTRFNGKRAVLITASQQDKQNIFKVGDQAWPIIEKFQDNLSPDMELIVNFDSILKNV